MNTQTFEELFPIGTWFSHSIGCDSYAVQIISHKDIKKKYFVLVMVI